MKNNNTAKKSSFGSFIKSNKFKRGGMATLMSVVFIAIVVVLNILITALSNRFPSMNFDMTAQGLNTLSDQALEIARGVENTTEIFFIGEEDKIRKDQIYSGYGFQYSQVANLAERLQEANSKISVRFIDPDANPDFMNTYAEDSLSTGSVVVRTEKRHRVLTINDLFVKSTNQATGRSETYSIADSALAGALEAVNLENVPVVAVATGHNELLTSSARSGLDNLLERENFEVQEVNLLTDEIPAEAQVLMLPTPSTDYTDAEIEKMKVFLSAEASDLDRTIFVTSYYSQGELPKLAAFLEEWGVKVEPSVVAETESSQVFAADASYIFAKSAEEVLTDNDYNLLVAPLTSPISLYFTANDDISVKKLWVSSDSAYAVTGEDSQEDPKTGEQVLATMSSKLIQPGNNTYIYKNVVVFGNSLSFTESFLSNTFGNRAYVSDLFHEITKTDDSALSVSTERVQTSTVDIVLSVNTVIILGLWVFTIAIPVIILIVGLVVFLKRRHL